MFFQLFRDSSNIWQQITYAVARYIAQVFYCSFSSLCDDILFLPRTNTRVLLSIHTHNIIYTCVRVNIYLHEIRDDTSNASDRHQNEIVLVLADVVLCSVCGDRFPGIQGAHGLADNKIRETHELSYFCTHHVYINNNNVCIRTYDTKRNRQ